MAKDEITGKIKQNRSRDKIQYQTSFTDLPMFVSYCKYIKQKERIAYNDFSNELGLVRKQFKSWKGDKDTHAKLTLLQFGLIYLDKGFFQLTQLGESFLFLFDDNYKLVGSKDKFLEIIFSMMDSWHYKFNDYDIHPGKVILKLLLEPDLHYYVTSQDIAHIFIYCENKLDIQYESMKAQIIEFRQNGTVYNNSQLKKTFTLLTGFVKWDIFVLDKKSNATIKIVRMQNDFAKVVKKHYVNMESECLTEENIMDLIDLTDSYDIKIDQLISMYGESGYKLAEQKTRIGQIQASFKKKLIAKNSLKCMLCNISHSEMIVASHIKSYNSCESVAEKIDENNGLLLCANHDKSFDRFLISFDAFTGKILISQSISEEERKILLIDSSTCLDLHLLTEKRQEYLIWHNSEFYKKNRG